MKKLTGLVVMVAMMLLVSPTLVWGQQGTRAQDRVQDPETHATGSTAPQGNQVNNQNEVQTQNMGEETQLMVATSEMEQLMVMENADEEVGSKVRVVAQEQVQAQSQIETQLAKVESRSSLTKKLFGPDYGAVNNLKKQMEQNQLRIQQLEALKAQVTNESDATQLETAIMALVDQNTALSDKIMAEEEVSSLFGWLMRLFAR